MVIHEIYWMSIMVHFFHIISIPFIFDWLYYTTFRNAKQVFFFISEKYFAIHLTTCRGGRILACFMLKWSIASFPFSDPAPVLWAICTVIYLFFLYQFLWVLSICYCFFIWTPVLTFRIPHFPVNVHTFYKHLFFLLGDFLLLSFSAETRPCSGYTSLQSSFPICSIVKADIRNPLRYLLITE